MKAVQTILVPVDFSAASRAAVRHARDLAEVFGSRVCLLHAMAFPDVPAWAPGVDQFLQRLQDDQADEAGREMAALIWEERLNPRKTMSAVLTGRPVDVVPIYAEELDADLIVMGLHEGHRAPRLTSHIAERLLRAVRCPLLVVPPPGDASHASVAPAA